MSKTIQFFKEIAKIPRESGNEKKIAEYLCKFAKSRNLEYTIDKYNNVLIRKKTADRPGLILQGHTDMVCVSQDSNFDFANMPIEVIEENGYLRANNTTLGADNGIGVAQILNVLDNNWPYNIEAIFTASEETTMAGAKNFDVSKIEGKYLLNLDGFDENLIVNESAAYYDLIMKYAGRKVKATYPNAYKVELTGLAGGHSGYDLDKGRGNAIILLAKFLLQFSCEICEFKGGTKNNVFSSQATAIINSLEDIQDIECRFLNEYRKKYPNLEIKIEKIDNVNDGLENSTEYLEFLSNFPSKAINYNENDEPTTSINLGVINDTHLEIGMRSSREREALKAIDMLDSYGKKYKLELIKDDYQPGFYSNKNSKLIQKLVATCPYPEPAKARALHITVEAGFFQEKRKDIEIAIISPNIEDAHSTKERVNIKSIEMADKWLEEFIKAFE